MIPANFAPLQIAKFITFERALIIKDMWEETGNKLCKTFEFKDFNAAFGWMARVALAAEKMDHHPEWTNIYNKVSVKLCTHSAGDKITDKDRKLAELMDKIHEGK